MHILNPLPQLLVFGFFAPTLLRIVAAFVFFYLASFHYRNRAAVGKELTFLTSDVARVIVGIYILVEAAVGLCLLAGYYTQIAALIGFAIPLKVLLVRRGLHNLAPLSRLSYLLLSIICLSLLFTGAGAMAIDLPL